MANLPEICYKCGLYKGCKSPLTPGHGSENPDIIFIGEALGHEEDEQGIPFVGKTGQKLRNDVAAVELEKVRYTNVVRCRPPDNRTPTAKEVACCSEFLVEELANYQPKVVVLLGGTPLKAMLGLGPITAYQGQAIEQDGITYVPSFHPSYVMRQHGTVDEDWYRTFEVILQTLDGTTKPVAADAHYQYLYPMSIEELEEMRDELLSDLDELVVCDMEGISVDVTQPGNKIISIAFANGSKAWSFPVDHKESWWDTKERQVLQAIVTQILTQCKIINHFIKVDSKMIRRFLGVDFVPYGDSIQLSRLVRPESKEHGLKRLAGIHLQMFDYDEELQQYVAKHPECDYKRGGNYGNIPLEILLPYGGKDVSATRMLHDTLYPQLTEQQRILYEQMIMPADYAIGLIEENGFKLDYWIIKRYLAVYQAIMDHKYLPAMLQDEEVKLYIHAQELYLKLEAAGLITKEKQGKQYVCKLTIGQTEYPFAKGDWHDVYIRNRERLDALDATIEKPKRWKPFEFNPNSAQQVSPVIYSYKNLVKESDKIARTDSGAPSIKRDVLKEVVYDLTAEGIHDQFLEDYMNWKLLASITSKTFNAMLRPGSDWYSHDGRVRSIYTIGGAKSGRTASSQPNLQNIPAVEKEPGTVLQYLPAKNAFTHTFEGGGLAMIDYSGMELRVISSIAGIQGMIDVFNRKGDVHRHTSSLIYRIPEDQIDKFKRYRGKWCNWSLLYLGNWWTLVRLYRTNGITPEEAKRIAALYFEAYPQLPKYHKVVGEFLLEHGYVESKFGRRLPLPAIYDSVEAVRQDTLRTAVNFPIQGLASDVLMVALAIITKLTRGKGYKSMFVNTVHDSLVLDYHPDEVEKLVELSTDVMENVVDYAAEFMPGLDFSWLKVPLVADVDYGTHYGIHGFYQPVICSCGYTMILSDDVKLGLVNAKEEYIIGFDCANCGAETTKVFEPLLYNNTHPEAKYLKQEWQQVLYNNDYQGKRMPRRML